MGGQGGKLGLETTSVQERIEGREVLSEVGTSRVGLEPVGRGEETGPSEVGGNKRNVCLTSVETVGTRDGLRGSTPGEEKDPAVLRNDEFGSSQDGHHTDTDQRDHTNYRSGSRSRTMWGYSCL